VTSLLEAYGITPKDQQVIDVLRPLQCPNCQEPNKPDSRFCARCRMVLTYDAYNETLEGQKQKEDELSTMKQQFNNMQSMLEKLITGMSNIQNPQQFGEIAKSLFTAGMLKVQEK
jgi:predicted amidophosphoribosyltransferase